MSEPASDHAVELNAFARRRGYGDDAKPLAVKLPPIRTFSELFAADLPLPDELIHGVLHQGSKLMLGGGSKSFKTWVLLDLALSIATGTPWWGLATKAAPVLFVNLELQERFCRDRLKAVMEAKHLADAPNLHTWHLRGYAADLAVLLPQFLVRTDGGRYAAIILDPIYKALGDRDENAAGDVALLLNEVEALAVRTGASVVFGHHYAKGDATGKAAQDRVSGSGVWARDPDALITLTPHEEEGAFVVDYVLRNFRPRTSHVVRWKYPTMEIAPGLDPAALKKPGRPKENTVSALLALFVGPDELLTWSELRAKAGAKGISETSFKRLLKEATEAGRVTKTGAAYRAVAL